ncbi:hypothetical protein PVAP13_1NG537419 [Panicum virgatum]|uniref:Uncharacterized protein n=1 Tax=Panicum virgatum TaxID=38727 RepID=A0A8T0X9U2_PANVG|nr:hypothetical protein PVAP13_1NG537419 [Panicum virgatum]
MYIKHPSIINFSFPIHHETCSPQHQLGEWITNLQTSIPHCPHPLRTEPSCNDFRSTSGALVFRPPHRLSHQSFSTCLKSLSFFVLRRRCYSSARS